MIIGAGTIFYLANKENPNWAETLDREEKLDALAQLSAIEYGLRRNAVAKAMKISVKILDDEIVRLRKLRRSEKITPRLDVDAEKLAALAKPIIDCPNVLALFADQLAKRIAGESKSGRLLYLAATSRLLEKTMHVAIKGTSSGGKSELRHRVLDFIPPEDVVTFSALSDKALLYFEDDFSHKILSMGEAMVGKQQEFQDSLLRQLMSESRLNYLVSQKSPDGKIVTINIEKNGPVVFMVTTARNRLHPENETRMISLEIDDREGQTKAVMQKIAEVEGLNCRQTIDLEPWLAFQRWLKTDECRVVIPFADHLAQLIPARSVRLRRDFGQLLLAIKTHALIHRAHRERDGQGAIIASLGDYGEVRKLMADVLSVASEVKYSRPVRETIEAIDAANEEVEGKGVSIREVASQLNLDNSSARRRIRAAENLGLVINVDERPGRGLNRLR